MLRSYKFVQTNNSKLQEFVLSFFERIENEKGEFDDSFFDAEFRDIVNHHPEILKERFIKIYNEVRKWSQIKKVVFCRELKESNDIEGICRGNKKPLSYEELPDSIKEVLKDLFIDLYEKILKKSPHFCNKCGTLQEHFEAFKSQNSNTICPACGLNPVKTQFDDARNQYDHYLPKSIYPLSSINFKNLIPICPECNSLAVKGEIDVLRETNGILFYPYDQNHSGINIDISVIKDSQKIADIKWAFNFTAANGFANEIQSWKYIFKIESRYEGYIKGRIESWFSIYWQVMKIEEFQLLSLDIKMKIYDEVLKADKDNEVDYIRQPALKAFLKDSVLLRAELEAKLFSLPVAN